AGVFLNGGAVIVIILSQFLAGRSDKKGVRKKLIVFCVVLRMFACVLFAWNRNYFILLFIGVFLSRFGSTANPQMFALAREHADRTGREAVMFSSILRAQVSLAGVIGPPLAYALAMGFSFRVVDLSAAGAFIVCGVMVWF
ncbi:MFS transporter, partial [Salmonella enterica]|uniref:MFS transporter n=1 Tax=Salmonella enterica TaxID=28901 RepID=UPI002ADEE393